MVSFKTLATAATALIAAPLASAYITALDAPLQAKAGETITVTLTTASYSQNYDDFSIAWGLADPSFGGANSDGHIYIGTQISYTQIYPDNKPDPSKNTFTVDVPIPAGQAPKNYLLVAAVPYLVGVSFFYSPFNRYHFVSPSPLLTKPCSTGFRSGWRPPAQRRHQHRRRLSGLLPALSSMGISSSPA
ncbi:hypothetical protein F4810DRAFT_665491 [Camillea tinctor]|nr:hypothetical protein F4810DRAFT_665491 [Camillea tinctor]